MSFYNYIYLDPRKPGKYTYNGLGFCLLFEPFYVGKGKGKRYLGHLDKWSLKKQSHKNNKIKKIVSLGYNLEDFIILINSGVEEIILEKEKEIIKNIGRYDLNLGPLTNKTGGGDGVSGLIHSEESKEKNRQWHLGRKHTEESRKLISMNTRGENNPFYGRTWDKENRLRISKQCKGYKFTDSQKLKVSNGLRGKPKSLEHCKNLSIIAKKRERVGCPHCGKIGQINAMKRWHFENCKYKLGEKK